MTTTKRVLYTLGAAALLLVAAPALADDAAPAHACAARCPCARMAQPAPGSKASASDQPTASADRADAFLQEVWGAP